jgi:hypothetical protein
MMTDEPVIDLREADQPLPTHCEACGAALIYGEGSGRMWLGPADHEIAGYHDLELGQWVTQVWTTWRCPSVAPTDDGYWGPDETHTCGPVAIAYG